MNQNSKKIKKNKQPQQQIDSVQNLFSQKIKDIQPIQEEDEEEIREVQLQKEKKINNNPLLNEEQSMATNQDRLERAIFVGNVPLSVKKIEILKIFKDYGKIEKIWIRSVPVQKTKGLTKKAQIILKKFKESASQTCNYYILYENKLVFFSIYYNIHKKDAKKALNSNGKEIGGYHIRVDSAKEPERDYITTIFIGNLPFRAKEEEIRNHFSECGDIDNVRIIRDENFKGKGFAYIKFSTLEGYQNGIAMNNTQFQERQLRIKKAVPLERLQKKIKNNAQKRIKQKSQKQNKQQSGLSMKQLKQFADKDVDAELRNKKKQNNMLKAKLQYNPQKKNKAHQ